MRSRCGERGTAVDLSPLLSLSLEGLLVEPRPEDGQRGRVLDLGLGRVAAAAAAGAPEGAAVGAAASRALGPQRVRGQHDGQLELDRLLQVARGHDELEELRGRGEG